jgi:hypothetical protein
MTPEKGNTLAAKEKSRQSAALELVFAAVLAAGAEGVTGDELAAAGHIHGGRFLTSLRRAGRVRRAGTRATRSGCAAVVYVAEPCAPSPEDIAPSHGAALVAHLKAEIEKLREELKEARRLANEWRIRAEPGGQRGLF